MEAVPRLSMISVDLKSSPSNTEFSPVLKKYIRDHYHEDPESYTKEIKELETLRQNAIKAPMDFTGCSILKKYYSQLQKLQSRFPMTDDGVACVPFMWTDIYSGVAYNITDVEYEEACILYNIGALHSKLGTMDTRINAEGIKIACTHFQCAAWAFQHLRDTYPQPKGSDMSHDLLTFFINVMLAQAQECILEKSMLDNRKSSITAKIATQVVDYYKCALGIMVSGSPSTDTGSILDIVGSKVYKSWKKFIDFKMSYYMSIAHLYMGNQAEENQKWGERVAWFQSAYDHLTEAFKIAKKIDREDLTEPLTFTSDVVGGKHNSSKKENDFVYHDKVPALSSLPELKGASLVKGIPFSSSDPEVSGPDIFARLVPMEAHETSSLYSEEKAKILRSVDSKIEGKNEELMAYLSTLQLESAMSFDEEDKVPQELIEKCAALSVRPTIIADLTNLMSELLDVSKDVEASLKSSMSLLAEEDQKELKHQEAFGKRGPSMITVDLKKECSKYEEAHKKAVESNKTLQAAVSIHISNLTQLSAPLDQITEALPSACSLKTPENVKTMDEFNHLVNKVDEMRKQRQFLENKLRDALIKDDITKHLVTLDKKDDLQRTFAEQLKKHNETLIYLDQNLAAQDNILCALTEANARYADTRKALREIRIKREERVKTLVNSFDAYEDLMEKARKGLVFYKRLQNNVTRLLTRIKSVTKVQHEERAQRADAELRKGGRMPAFPSVSHEPHTPKLKDYLPYLNKHGGAGGVPVPNVAYNMYPSLQPHAPSSQIPYVPEPMRQATLGGPASADFDRSLKPSPTNVSRPEDTFDVSSMGIRPNPVGSEQTSVPAMCTTALTNAGGGHMSPFSTQQPWNATAPAVNSSLHNTQVPYQYPTQPMMQQPANSSSNYVSNNMSTVPKDPISGQGYNPDLPIPNINTSSYSGQNYGYSQQLQVSHSTAAPLNSSNVPYSSYGNMNQSGYQSSTTNMSGSQVSMPSTSVMPGSTYAMQNSTISPGTTYPPGSAYTPGSAYMPGSAYPSNFAQPPNSNTSHSSAHLPNSAIPSGIPVVYPGSATNHSTVFSPNSPVPSLPFSQNSGLPATASGNYTATAVRESIRDKTSFNNGGINSFTSSTSTLPSNSYAMPYSNQQTYATPSIPPSSNNASQNQTYAGWQPNQMYSAPTNYAVPSSSYYSTTVPNASYSSTMHPQYYQGPGVSVQANQACVTASIDTKTNTLNSLHSYAVSNTSASNSEQNMYAYIGNSPLNTSGNVTSQVMQGQTTISAPGAIQSQNAIAAPGAQQPQVGISSPGAHQPQVGVAAPGTVHTQTGINYGSQNSYSINPVSPSNVSMYSTVPSAYTYAGNSMYTQSNYNYYSSSNNQVLPNATYVGSLPITSTLRNLAVQNNVPTSNVNMQHNNYAFPNQQNYQPAFNTTDSLSSINVAYGSNSNISNQQLQTPMEPKPVTPTQPIESNVVDGDQLKNSSTPIAPSEPIPKSLSVDLQTPVQRDFITPPPDPVNNSESDKSKEELQVLQPKVIDLKAISEMKEKEPIHLAKDPLDDISVCTKFALEVEKYEKLVDGLVRKSLNGTTPLDQKWKELTDVQDKESRKRSISVARCCPLKNRFPDVMPYDCNRVKLATAKDDYINASYLKDICPNCPVFVITQAPLPSTFNDFWLMVWEQQIETLVCLLSDTELKNHVYFPKERGQVMTFGSFEISIHSCKEKNGFVERMINLTHTKNRTSRVVVHLQYTEWPTSGVPSSPPTLLQFIADTISYYKQQRNLMRPIVVHCSAGIGRSGCFCIITALVSEMNNGHGPRDVAQVAAMVSHQRKFLIQDKDQLKFCYDTVLYYAQDLLMRRGILTTRASFDSKLPGSTNTSSHVRHPSEDFILGGGLAKLQSGIAKLGLSSDNPEVKLSDSEIKTAVEDTSANETTTSVESGDIKVDSQTCDNALQEATKLETEPNAIRKEKELAEKPVSSITSLLDPSNFTMDATSSPAKRKITKENFAASKGTLSTTSSDSADPLSQLDPLWSLKK